jgi:glucose/arabinose dehydrogenase
VRVPFRNGQPTGDVEDFLTGFAIGDSRWARPVDVVFGPDGALYVTDDQSGAIYRVTAAVSGP